MKQSREENNNNGKKADKMHVKEWLHQNAKRPVKAKFGPDETIYLLNRKGDKLRTISIKSVESLVVEITQDTNKKPMVLIRVLKDHDLVLEFSYVAERKKFLAKLENFLQGNYSVGWSSPVFPHSRGAAQDTQQGVMALNCTNSHVSLRGWKALHILL